MNIPAVTAAMLAERTDLAIVDIREPEERLDGLGWIPGSVHAPVRGPIGPDWVRRRVGDRTAVLACMSGRRSGQLVAVLAGDVPVLNLDGGLLGWMAEGLPVCRRDDRPVLDEVIASLSGPLSPQQWRRQVLSCFVAEAVEALDDDDLFDAFDPVAVVTKQLEAARDAVSARAAIDRLGDLARQNGHPLDKVARNITFHHLLADAVSW